jgi:hypothetical protein
MAAGVRHEGLDIKTYEAAIQPEGQMREGTSPSYRL